MAKDRGADLGRELSTAVVMFHEAVGQHLGVSAGDQRALALIRGGPLPAGALAKEIGLTPGAVTGMIDRLEAAGLVRREVDPNDRRRVLVDSTESGISAHSGLFDELAAAMGKMVGRYTAAEQAVIGDYVVRTIGILREQTARLTERR
ncbi:MarR family transcriptional regulator [Umezawaea sp. Da 62-37]|uniref:MarR family transcriptional regulator n=1 Tax=Umezawaea sp. Da 62-37 TaxID=3075927 RepID=UPI0028F6E0C3|nr:MarR family transcriptional regulator [Umezawaea sp. Da 62-37]WNV84399.1 MarR family transcriptional regulator [Umezawaea sp. Da 62-37]